MATIVLYKKQIKHHHPGLENEWLLKSTLRKKKRNLTTDIQQQLTSTQKKKLGRILGRKNQSYKNVIISLASQTYCQHHGRA